MIVGFSKHCKGGGNGPVNYLTQDMNPDGSARTPLPQVVRGDAELVRRLIDAVPFERTYTSGVLSFAPGEIITPAMEQAIMDGFERVAFAGIGAGPLQHPVGAAPTRGTSRIAFRDAAHGIGVRKSLNIHPPGRVSQRLYDTFRSMVNAEYGLADPTDPARARDVSLPNHIAKLQADASRKGKALDADIREAITAYVRREVEAGRIRNQAGVVRYLQKAGYEITRAGENYITVMHPETKKRVRLKGGLYSREGFNARETTTPRVQYGIADPQRTAELAATAGADGCRACALSSAALRHRGRGESARPGAGARIHGGTLKPVHRASLRRRRAPADMAAAPPAHADREPGAAAWQRKGSL